MGRPKSRRPKDTISPSTKAILKLLQDEDDTIEKKDKQIQSLQDEVRELREQISLLLERESTRLKNAESNDSSREDEGLTTTDDDMVEDKSTIHSVETVTGASEEDASFDTVKNRKTRRTERFSSDEEISAQSQLNATPSSSPVRSPLRTPEGTPAKKAKRTKMKSGKADSATPLLDNNNFPSLPPPKPAANISAASLAQQPIMASPTTAPKVAKRPSRPKAIPPIVITNAGNFVSISSLFREHKIHYTFAAVIRNGIKIFPATEPDFRKATALLEEKKEPYFTFRFPEEKLIHVVLRGIPIHLTNEEIVENLSLQGFSPKKIIRWHHADGKPMPMILALLPQSETNIYKVRFVCNFEVRAEARKSKPRGIQCFNCQDHGHAAPCCHVPAKCVKCGEDHHTSKCTKSRDVPARCANCSGDHPASFSGCPRHPSQQRPKQPKFKGWGTPDNSCLAPSNPQPAPAPNEVLFSTAQLAQLTQLVVAAIQAQLKTANLS